MSKYETTVIKNEDGHSPKEWLIRINNCIRTKSEISIIEIISNTEFAPVTKINETMSNGDEEFSVLPLNRWMSEDSSHTSYFIL